MYYWINLQNIKCKCCAGNLDISIKEEIDDVGNERCSVILYCKRCAGNIRVFSLTTNEMDIDTAVQQAIKEYGALKI